MLAIIAAVVLSILAPAAARRRARFLSPPPPVRGEVAVTGEVCVHSNNSAQVITQSGTTLLVGGACLTCAAWPPSDGTALTLAPCDGTPQQDWNLVPGGGDNAISLTLAANTALCVNLAGYGTTPGTQVWLYTCTDACEGNCAWQRDAAFPGALRNPGSSLCLNAGAAPPPGPPPPHTCDPGSPSVALPFCDGSAPVAARVEDLFSRLTDAQRTAFFSIPAQPNAFDADLNLPSVFWDIT